MAYPKRRDDYLPPCQQNKRGDFARLLAQAIILEVENVFFEMFSQKPRKNTSFIAILLNIFSAGRRALFYVRNWFQKAQGYGKRSKAPKFNLFVGAPLEKNSSLIELFKVLGRSFKRIFSLTTEISVGNALNERTFKT